MRRIISLIIVSVLGWTLFDDVIFAQKSNTDPEQEAETKVIDLTADIVYPITLNDTVEVMCLVGDFAAQHNGAIITADSAVRYSDKRLECFGNVLINKNTTYAYADRADYNGEENEVSLYAPIIKVVDGDAILYCYNFRFNTLENVGIYEGGGVMINGENLMESLTGYYFSDTKELIGVGDVQLKGDEYEMTSDSIIYNTATEAAIYFENTNIWNQEDEYLYADAGDYDKQADRYSFSRNGYILTKEQEMWGDSMDYYRASEHIFMRNNIQIDDTTQKSLIFGDYGEYVKTPGNIFFAGNPSIINYDVEQGDSLFMRADTFQVFTLNRFIQSDSTTIVAATELAEIAKMEIEEHDDHDHDHDHDADHDHDHDADHDHDHDHDADHDADHDHDNDVEPVTPQEVSAPKQAPEEAKSGEKPVEGRSAERPSQQGGGAPAAAPQGGGRAREVEDLRLPEISKDQAPSTISQEAATKPTDDTLRRAESFAVDSLRTDSLALDSLSLDSMRLDSLSQQKDSSRMQRMIAKYKAASAQRAAEKAVRDAARKVVLDSIGMERQNKINAKLDAESVREARRVAERRLKVVEREADKVRRRVSRGKISAKDTVALMSELAVDTAALIRELSHTHSPLGASGADSLSLDSLALDSLALDSLRTDSLAVDSMYRLTKGFRNVKIYRSDFQAVADSMVTSSIDSIIRLYLNPILWHDANQVTSDVMDIYTEKNQISKAIFTEGSPIMASEVTPGFHYNQVAGKVITSLFANGAIYRNDADGNAQTIYFMQDDDTGEANGLTVIESGSTTFYIEEQAVTGITYRLEPSYNIYPMNMIPADQSLSLKGFEWQKEKRPEQKDVFDRVIRPTVREEKDALPRPTYPLNFELQEHIQYLIDSKLWIDRNDLVSPHAEEWMESLGYKTGQPREQNDEQKDD